jgi:hypothetical protein
MYMTEGMNYALTEGLNTLDKAVDLRWMYRGHTSCNCVSAETGE